MPFHDAERYLEEADRQRHAAIVRRMGTAARRRWVDRRQLRSAHGATRQGHPGQIRYLEHPGHANLGAGPTRNLGISRANGEFLVFLDADDVLLPHKLSRQLNLLQRHPTAIMVYGATEYWTSWNTSAAPRTE